MIDKKCPVCGKGFGLSDTWKSEGDYIIHDKCYSRWKSEKAEEEVEKKGRVDALAITRKEDHMHKEQYNMKVLKLRSEIEEIHEQAKTLSDRDKDNAIELARQKIELLKSYERELRKKQ
jgi:hypothetical protein